MTSHKSFAALQRANPRQDSGFETDVRASAGLVSRIMTTDPAPSASRRPLWRWAPRRRLTLIAVTGGIILLGGGAAYAELGFPGPVPRIPDNASESDIQTKGFLNWKQYSAEYDTWTHKIALPPGAKWRGCDPAGSKPSTDGTTVGYYLGAGASDAVWEGMGHWAIEWGAAVKAGDDTRVAQAEAWVVHLRALLRTGGDSVDHPGDEMRDNLGPEEARILDAAIAEAKKGHVEKLSHLDMVIGYTVPYTTSSTSP